ncbi:5-(methylthio)ribulose-1-phosphate aldolase [Brucella sp. NBRC 12953]|jgi:L-fuculose-phosphate aldolase
MDRVNCRDYEVRHHHKLLAANNGEQTMPTDYDQSLTARRAIVDAMRHMEQKGFNHGSSGNISIREGEHIWVTPTGATSLMKPEDMSLVSVEGEHLAGKVPSSEWRIHTEIMRNHPEAGAVIHSHADSCVALSCLRKPLPAFHYMIASFGGNEVPCADYRVFGSDALAYEIVRAMGNHRACLMASHGMVVWGRDMAHATLLAEKLETLARQYILACQIGEPVLLSETELDEVRARYGYYGSKPMPR